MKIPMIGQQAGKSYAYILGLYMGDGCVSRQPEKGSHRFRLNVIDKDFAEYAMGHLFKLTGRKTSIFQQNGHFWAFSFGWKALCDHLEEVTDKKKKIPEFVFGWNREMKQKFIEAQLDSDGYVAVDKKRQVYSMGFKNCDSWFDDFVKLLHDVGLKTGKIGHQPGRKPGYLDAKRVYINLQSWLKSGFSFSCGRKQDRIKKYELRQSSTTNTLGQLKEAV